MSNRPTKILLEDIFEAIEKITRYIAEMDYDAFVQDDRTVDAVVRNLGIIGEAANRLPDNFKQQYQNIP